MKKKQPAKQQPGPSTPLSTTELTEEQLQQVVGGIGSGPCPPPALNKYTAGKYQPDPTAVE